MQTILEKLDPQSNKQLLVQNIPTELLQEFKEGISHGAEIHDERMPSTIYDFALVFVDNEDEIGASASMIVKSLIKGEPTFWIAFPTPESPDFKGDLTSSESWTILDAIGFKEIEMEQINEHWKAKRFTRK